jgi:hypothetical protein
VAFLTLSADRILEPTQRTTIEALVPSGGKEAVWRSNLRTGRTYALFELASILDVREARRAIDASGLATAYETAIIAIAVFPTVAQALPPVVEALSGPGRPEGILSVSGGQGGGAVVEWDPERSAPSVVLGLIDVELRRFNAGRTTEVLSPLSSETIARIARTQLQAPQVATDRILDVLLEQAGFSLDRLRTGDV